MKFLTSLCILLSTSSLWASDMAFQGGLGFSNSAINIAADVDFQRKSSHSFGGYFVLGTEKDNVRGQFWSLGGDVKVFFGPGSDWKLYLGPGIGIVSYDSTPTSPVASQSRSETTLGAIMKVGALFEVSYDMHFGMEYMHIHNWLSDETYGGTYNMINAVLRIGF